MVAKGISGALLAISLVACGDDGGGGTIADAPSGGSDVGGGSDTGGGGENLVDGMIVPVGGGSAPAMGKTFVIWVSDIGQGDFVYKYGEGTATMTTFTANVTPPVPNDATFGGKLGVGFVALVPSGTVMADGVADEAMLSAAMLGLSGEYTIIYRPNTTPFPEATWANDFPAGLSCGKCVEQTTGFDTFTPVPCSEMKLQVGPEASIKVCDWT